MSNGFSSELSGTGPILCAHLLRRVDGALVELLHALPAEDWDRPTIAGNWRVRDVVAHLLDTALRKLSMVRDGAFVERVQIRSQQDVIDLVNRLNREGVTVYRRLSATVLTGLMETACEESARFHESLDPFAQAAFSVSWAGEETSLNWFDTARELTERWHHQQQIRLAVGRPGIMTRELYFPVLDCFVRGLPFAYRDVAAVTGTGVLLEIAGDCGGRWLLQRTDTGWGFASEMSERISARVMLPEAIAWRVFTKGIGREEARALMSFEGDAALGEGILRLTAIVG
jgi:uncharacterized protein (TIGR03083 family)